MKVMRHTVLLLVDSAPSGVGTSPIWFSDKWLGFVATLGNSVSAGVLQSARLKAEQL